MKKTHTLSTASLRRAPVASIDPDLLPLRPRTNVPCQFIFVHYESAWEYDAEHGWIPRLSKLLAKPGVNGVGKDGNLQPAINGATAKGGTIIRDDDRRLLRDGEDVDSAVFYGYGRYYRTVNRNGSQGPHWYAEPGAVPSVTPSGRILWNHDEQSRIFAAFRAHIRDTGIIQPMHPLTLAEHLDAQGAKVERLKATVAMNPHLAGKLTEATELLDAMQPTEQEVEADTKAARKVTRSRRSRSDG